MNPKNGFNSYWQMPFRQHCRITIENLADAECMLFYQVNYQLTEVPEDAAYFHAQFRRTNPLPYAEEYTIIDGVSGRGHYVGTAVAWGANSNGWWGEGEIKLFLDCDEEAPTICGTGTEDYFCGLPSGIPGSGAVSHVHHAVRRDAVDHLPRWRGPNLTQTRFGLYRWHITDPIRFRSDLKVTMQALGWRSGGRYLPLQDDIATVAYWYQTLPTAPFPEFPDTDALEII